MIHRKNNLMTPPDFGGFECLCELDIISHEKCDVALLLQDKPVKDMSHFQSLILHFIMTNECLAKYLRTFLHSFGKGKLGVLTRRESGNFTCV